MSQLRCNGCREWFDKKQKACPTCGTVPHAFNVALRAAGLNAHLYAQADRAKSGY